METLPLHVAWVTTTASWAGGAERYVGDAARRLRERGVRNTLLYDAGMPGGPGGGATDPTFTGIFDAAFPLLAGSDGRTQVSDLSPDLLYAHRLSKESRIRELDHGVPIVRFHHDHKLLCPREYKYRTLSHQTCTRTVGLACYPCLGFVQRAHGLFPIKLRTVGAVVRDQRAHHSLAAHVVGSQYMANHLVAHDFDPNTVHVIHPFIEDPTPSAPRPSRDPTQLLFAGAVLRGKGLDLLVRALHELPTSVRLTVCGSGHQETMFREIAESLGVASRIDFRGKVDRETLTHLYRTAACLVVPSREPETFGLVGPEAMLLGTPVVVSRVGGTGEWAREGETASTFKSGDVADLAATLRRVLDDPAAAQAMAERGGALVRTAFTPQRHVDALLDLFQRVRA